MKEMRAISKNVGQFFEKMALFLNVVGMYFSSRIHQTIQEKGKLPRTRTFVQLGDSFFLLSPTLQVAQHQCSVSKQFRAFAVGTGPVGEIKKKNGFCSLTSCWGIFSVTFCMESSSPERPSLLLGTRWEGN